jgi:HEAT repeat protein
MARLRAAEALGLIGDERSVRSLLAFLRNQSDREGSLDGEIFSSTRETLTQIGRKNPLLFREAIKDPDDYIRSEAARVLRVIQDPGSVPELIKALNDVNYVVRINAAETLGLLRDPRASEPLIRALKDVNRDVRTAARRSLEQIEGRGSGRGRPPPAQEDSSGRK